MLSSLGMPIAEHPPHLRFNYSLLGDAGVHWHDYRNYLVIRLVLGPLAPLAPCLKLTAGLGYLFTSAALPGDAGILGMDRIQTPNLFDS